MHSLAQFFQTNNVLVTFVYGEAFFVLGLAIALQSRKHSQLVLARRLWLLASFGFIHGVYEWGAVFIPIQQTYLPASAISILKVLQLVIEAASFLALLQFGVELIAFGYKRLRWLSTVPALVFLGWALVIFIAETQIHVTLDDVLVLGDILARYSMGVTGTLAAAWGLWWQAEQVREMDLPRIANYFRVAAYAFIAYAVTTAIVPQADFFPASVLNYTSVLNTIGVPVPVFRAILGAAMAYLIIRGSEIFDIETDRLLEEVAQARAVTVDRERIGRELHDSIIQSLYAAGLMLEDASLTIDEDTAQAKERIREVISALNRAIRDIRRYILDLRGEISLGNLSDGLNELVRTFRIDTLIDAALQVKGDIRTALTREEASHVLTIAREALTNVSKHAQATRVDLTLDYRSDEIELDIADNGVGMTKGGNGRGAGAGEHQGLRNMQERARIIGATLTVESEPGKGTCVRLLIPLRAKEPSKAKG